MIENTIENNGYPVMLKSKWPARELDGKSVEFRIMKKGQHGNLIPIEGGGVFRSLENHVGLTRIEIVVSERDRDHSKFVDSIYYCPQESADLIQRQPVGSKFDFSLFEF